MSLNNDLLEEVAIGKLDTQGRLTIPSEIREKLPLNSGDKVQIFLHLTRPDIIVLKVLKMK